MDSHNVLAEDLQSVHRVCFAVHQKVCGVKVDSHIAFSESLFNILDGTFQGDRGLLTGLKEEILSVLLTFCHDGLAGYEHLFVFGIIGVLRHETDMGCQIGHMDLFRKIRTLQNHFHSLYAIISGYQAQGQLAFIEIPDPTAFPAAPEGSHTDAKLLNGFVDLLDHHIVVKGRAIPAHQLAAVHAEFF